MNEPDSAARERRLFMLEVRHLLDMAHQDAVVAHRVLAAAKSDLLRISTEIDELTMRSAELTGATTSENVRSIIDQDAIWFTSARLTERS
jgi:hypothetical protein